MKRRGSKAWAFPEVIKEDIFNGKEYPTLFDSGKSWTMAESDGVFTVEVVGDSLIYGMPAIILADSRGMRHITMESGGIVYVYLDEEIQPLYNAVPLLRFDVEEGQKLYVYDYGQPGEWDDEKEDLANRTPTFVKSVTSKTVNGTERREWAIVDEADRVVGAWVEGVGAPNAKSWATNMPSAFDLRMIDCRQEGEVIFAASDFSCSAGIRSIEAICVDEEFFDLQGRRLKNAPRGIYIRIGEKVLGF